MADMKPTENHPASKYEPKMNKGEFIGIGEAIELKDAPASANQKSGEPFGKGGE